MTVVGDEAMFGDCVCAGLYKAPRQNRPKWMRGCSDGVRTTRDGVKYVRRVGWRLEPGNRMFTTCAKREIITTTWRH